MSTISQTTSSSNIPVGDYPWSKNNYYDPTGYPNYDPWTVYPIPTSTSPFPKTWATDNTQGLEWPTYVPAASDPIWAVQPPEPSIEDLMKLFEKYNIPKPEMEPEPPTPELPKEKEKVHVGRFTDLDLDNDL